MGQSQPIRFPEPKKNTRKQKQHENKKTHTRKNLRISKYSALFFIRVFSLNPTHPNASKKLNHRNHLLLVFLVKQELNQKQKLFKQDFLNPTKNPRKKLRQK